jgi:phosphoglucomutase / phosphopentomutase
LENLTPKPESWEIENVNNNPLRSEPFDEVYESYFNDLKNTLCFHRDLNSRTKLKFTYTAMHGVGYEFSVESFKSFDHKSFIPVTEQIQPDPEFPTVAFPNPEEGRSALNLAIKTANENESTIILANDPDADRLAVAEKNLQTNEWKIFNGNEIGAMLGWWLWHNFKVKYREEIAKDASFVKNAYMLYSTVSSQILQSIAEVEGFNCEDTLTGFKWMGNRASELIQNNKHVIFSFEEAIGFLCGNKVLDKDGISAE